MCGFFMPPLPQKLGTARWWLCFFFFLASWGFPGKSQGLDQSFTICFGGRQLAGSHSGLSSLHYIPWLLILKWTNRSYSETSLNWLLSIYIFIFSVRYLKEFLMWWVFIFSSFSISVQKLKLFLHCYCCTLLSRWFHHDLIQK